MFGMRARIYGDRVAFGQLRPGELFRIYHHLDREEVVIYEKIEMGENPQTGGTANARSLVCPENKERGGEYRWFDDHRMVHRCEPVET